MSCEEKFREELHARGFRLTPQREVILEVLHHLPGCTTAEEIYQRVREQDSGIDLVTVYRTLELLTEIEFVKCVETGRKERLWQFTGAEHPHPHLYCRSCGALVGFDEQVLAGLSQYLLETYGFEAALGQLTIPGLCEACQQKQG